MRKILYIQYTNPAGYPPLEHSSRILADAGWKVLFLGTGAAGEANVLQFLPHCNIVVRQLPFCPAGPLQKLHYFWFLLWTMGWILFWRPQWVYASDLLACPVALALSCLPGIQVVYHEHDSPDGRAGGLFLRLCMQARKKLARRAQICVLPNQQRAEAFSKEVTPRETAFCVWNCPQIEEVRPPRSPRMNRTMVVYYHGVVGPSYVSLSVLKAIAMLPAEVRLRVIGYETVGTEKFSHYLKKESQRLAIEDRVELLGPMPRFQALEQCAQCDVGLATIPTEAQDINGIHKVGASNKPFDFLACGLALLVSDLPDWREMYVDSSYGLACNPESPESIAAALRWFLDHPDEMREMGERGRRRILEEWNYESQFRPVAERLSAEAR